MVEHYHNSSWLEHGGSPEKATKSAFVSAIDAYLKQAGKYQKNESKVTWNDVEDCLVLVSNNFSTQTSYENQTKKAITNKFVQEAMTEFLRSNLEIYFIENRFDAEKIAEQVLLNKRSREKAEQTRLNIKKKLSGTIDIANRVQKFVDCRSRDPETAGDLYRGGRQRPGQRQAQPGRGVPGHHARPGQDPQLPEGGLQQDLQKRDHHRPGEGAGLRRGGPEQARQGPGTSSTWGICGGARSSSAPMAMWTASRSAP